MSGKFITFEGGEGCGKSTQVERLAAALRAEGIEVVLTREPGGTYLAEEIRHLLKDQDVDVPTDRAELMLFLAARAQLVANLIRPALAAGKWVISDRFSDSTIAYQGYGRGMPIELIREMNAFVSAGLKPDLTLLLSVTPETALKRRQERERRLHAQPDRIELAGTDFHQRLNSGFAELARLEPERIVTIDANGTIDEVWEQIWKSLKHIR